MPDTDTARFGWQPTDLIVHRRVRKSDYVEAEHPRDKTGKWASGEGFNEKLHGFKTKNAEREELDRLGMLSLNDSTVDEREAVRYYKGSGYWPINKLLRNSPGRELAVMGATRTDEEYIAELDGLMAKSVLQTSVMVGRIIGCGSSDEEVAAMTAVVENLKAKKPFTDKGFVSTTATQRYLKLNQDTAERGESNRSSLRPHVFMHIEVPKGAHATYIESIESSNEDELLLPRNTTFDVEEARVIAGNDIVVKVKVRV